MSKGEISLESLKRIEANQQKLFEQANVDLENRSKELQMQALRLMGDQAERVRQQVYQSMDFAVRSLPWWKRSLANVMKLAKEYKECIDAETQRLISIEIGKTMIEKEKK